MFLSFILLPTQISVLLVFLLYVILGILETSMKAHLNTGRMKWKHRLPLLLGYILYTRHDFSDAVCIFSVSYEDILL